MPSRILFIGVPHYIGDLKRDPNLENYTYCNNKFNKTLRALKSLKASGFGEGCRLPNPRREAEGAWVEGLGF